MVKSIVIFLVLLLSSCSVSDPIITSEFDRQPVLFGFIQPDSVALRLEYTRALSGDVTADPIEYIDDAIVSIFAQESDTVVREFLSNGAGTYEGAINLLPGEDYRVVVNSPSAGFISTEAIRIPLFVGRVEVAITDYVGRAGSSEGRFQELSGMFTIDRSQDTESAEQAYLIEMTGVANDRRYDLVVLNELDEDFSRTCGLIAFSRLVFTDLCFQDPIIEIPFSAIGEAEVDFPKLAVSFYRISPLTYEHILTEFRSEDGFEALFVRPQLSITNVTGGLGFVAGRNGTSLIVEL